MGTEETVPRQMDHRLSKSPSIRDVSGSNQITPVGSNASLPKGEVQALGNVMEDKIEGHASGVTLA